MARKIETVDGDPEAAELMERIEGIEQRLQEVEGFMAKHKAAYKAAKEQWDELNFHLRELAKTRLEENPLFDSDQ